jgi:S-adenosylmethionine-dependent methyltransferase
VTNIIANAGRERFRSGADIYAAYLDTPEGRLRLDLAFANLQEFLPQSKESLSVLDIGAGPGTTAVRLAGLGFDVTLLDSSPQMLEIAERTAREAEVGERVTLQLGDAAHLEELLPGKLFDVVLCHNVLEYVDNPGAVLSQCAQLIRRDPPGLLSIVVRNRSGEVLKAAIQSGDLEAAERSLDAGCGYESLYGGQVRLFIPDELLAMSKEASLEMIAQRGVRVVVDYLPPQISREAEYEGIFELERKLGQRPEFAAVARYTQYLVRCAGPVEDVA